MNRWDLWEGHRSKPGTVTVTGFNCRGHRPNFDVPRLLKRTTTASAVGAVVKF